MIVGLHQDGRSQAAWDGQVLSEIADTFTPAFIPLFGLPIDVMPGNFPVNQTPEGAVDV